MNPCIAGVALLLLLFSMGCSSNATSSEVSTALARAMHNRLEEQAARSASDGVPWWPSWQASLFQVGFEGIDDDLEMSDELRDAIEAYWDGNEVIVVSGELSLAEQGELLEEHHQQNEERFAAYLTSLRIMADEDDDETAARGLLAVATMLQASGARSVYFQYPRMAMLDRLFLENRHALAVPDCALFDIVVTVDPAVDMATLVDTLDAVREHNCNGEQSCQELFGDVLLPAMSAGGSS